MLLGFSKDFDVFEAIKILDKTGMFELLTPNIYGEYADIESINTNDTYQNNQWNLAQIDIEKAWGITHGNSSIKVGIIDNGADYYHEDIDLNTNDSFPGYNFDQFSNQYYVPLNFTSQGFLKIYHGTACAGIIGGATNNSQGISGIAGGNNNNGITLVHYKVANGDDGIPTTNTIYYALNRIANLTDSVKVVSISVNMPDPGNLWNTPINTAYNNGVFIIASAGNRLAGETYEILEPACLDNVFAVGASIEGDYLKTMTNGNETDWASRRYIPGGEEGSFNGLDILAPGIRIPTTDITGTLGHQDTDGDDDYILSWRGTSPACPHVAGVAALILSINSNLTPAQITTILQTSGDNTDVTGVTRVNAYKALKYTIEHYGGTFNQDVILPAGETWNIQPGLTLNFNPNCRLIVNGTLNVQGTSSSPR